ncbi:MAG: UDP binding domain-containing protein [bacterium]
MLSFKPNTDDMREAPSIDIIQELQSEGVSVKAFDPVAMEEASQRLSGVEFTESLYDALEDVHAMVLLTEWGEFLDLDYERIKELLAEPVILDGRNVLPMEKLMGMGFEYYGVGRGSDRLEDVISKQDLIQAPAGT